jgi:hypothetical protein
MGGTWGLVGGVAGFLSLADLGLLLSSSAIDIPTSVAVVYAAMYLVLSIGQVTAMACLVPLGDSRTLARSSVLGALIVLACAPLLGGTFGVIGILGAVLLGEVTAVAAQVLRVFDRQLRVGGRLGTP